MAPLWLSSVAIVLASAALLYAWRVAVVLNSRIKVLLDRYEDGLDAGWKRDLDHRLMLMNELITEGLLHGKRREERARGVVRGALKRLDEAGVEDPSVEAEAEELGVGDGEDGIPAELPAMYGVLEPGRSRDQPGVREPSPIPGMDLAEYEAFIAEGA